MPWQLQVEVWTSAGARHIGQAKSMLYVFALMYLYGLSLACGNVWDDGALFPQTDIFRQKTR